VFNQLSNILTVYFVPLGPLVREYVMVGTHSRTKLFTSRNPGSEREKEGRVSNILFKACPAVT
jgi:hypothetical protein